MQALATLIDSSRAAVTSDGFADECADGYADGYAGRHETGDGYGHGTGLNCTAAPNALLLSANSASGPSSRDGGSFELDAGFEVDKTLMKRSPLVRTFVPILDFFKSRAGEWAGRPAGRLVMFGLLRRHDYLHKYKLA